MLARGITPVDWRGYLTQQRRWARSVLDLKFRTPAMLTGDTPALTRVMNALHGLNYLQPAFFLTAGMWLLLSMLATGTVPAMVAAISLPHAALLVAAMSLCHLYRQRFFLDPAREGGIHWRTRLLRLAKAPFLLLAVVDVIVGQAAVLRDHPQGCGGGKAAANPDPGVRADRGADCRGLGCRGGAPTASIRSPATSAARWPLTVCLGLIASDFLPVPAPFDARLIPRCQLNRRCSGNRQPIGGWRPIAVRQVELSRRHV